MLKDDLLQSQRRHLLTIKSSPEASHGNVKERLGLWLRTLEISAFLEHRLDHSGVSNLVENAVWGAVAEPGEHKVQRLRKPEVDVALEGDYLIVPLYRVSFRHSEYLFTTTYSQGVDKSRDVLTAST